MTDLINDTPKGSPLLYLRDDKLKETLNNFFLVYKNFENQILENATDNNLGITFNELIIKLGITKQSLNRVLKILLYEKMVIQEVNKKDKRMKNLFLSEESKKIINNLVSPTIKDISNAFQKSGSDSVNGFNQTFSNLMNRKK
jgi:DNA-binding MarR family transcriptional regulator